MQRPVLERSIIDGFKTLKAESVAMTSAGKRMFAGTNDGTLVLYECRPDSAGNRGYACSILDVIRKQSKDKKAISSMMIVEHWRTLIGIIDGTVMAYDSQFYQLLGAIPDSKGCHLFATHDRHNTVLVALKKKLMCYTWQSPGFLLRKEFNLVDVPKSLCCVGNSVVIGYRKFYECLDLATGSTSRLLDVDKECKMVTLEMLATPFRPESVLLSLGLQGVVLDLTHILSGAPFSFGSSAEERLEWSAQPTSVHVANPFLVSLLADAVEVHDLVSLHPLQKIQIASPSPHLLSMCTCYVEAVPTPFSNVAIATPSVHSSGAVGGNSPQPATAQCLFVCNGEQLSVLKMVPIGSQVSTLVAAGLFEEAIQLCVVCSNPDYTRGINIAHLYEQCGSSLLLKGDFEKAVTNFIQAGTDFVSVVRQFPELVPLPLHAMLNISVQPGKKLVSQVLHRAASAMAQFCSFHRQKVTKRADRAELLKESGIGGSKGPGGAGSRGIVVLDEDEEDYIGDAEEELRRAQLLDTVLLSALVSCHPSRRANVVELLSGPNRCQIESCSVLLASQGNSYTEALLWLFRSQNQHNRVLQALTEDKCVGVGAWTREQFYQWTSDYLRWLWYHEEDATLPKQALFALKPVLEYDAELGLSVLISRPTNKSSFGGKGVTISEVLQFLRSVSPKTNNVKNTFGANVSANNKSSRSSVQAESSRSSVFGVNSGIGGVVASTPLVNGHALGVAFLECLVSSGEAPPSMHDEFAQLLVDGLPLDNELQLDHSLNDLDIRDSDREALMLYKIYRRKLQNFLLNSTEYNPKRVLKFLPQQYLHENALVLSRLGRHRDVLVIYIHQLKNLSLAESYCDRMFKSAHEVKTRANDSLSASSPPPLGVAPASKASFASTSSSFSMSVGMQFLEAGEIYLVMFRVILETVDPPEAGRSLVEAGEAQLMRSLEVVIRLADKYFDRFDPNALLELLPPSTPVATVVRYLKTVMEFNNTRKRNLKIVHQLLRTREVNIRTSQSQVAAAEMS